MIAVVLAMLRVRWRRALAVGLLAAFTVGVAAAVPACLAVADQAMVAAEYAHASTDERTVSEDISLHDEAIGDQQLAAAETRRLTTPWSHPIFGIDIDVSTAPGPPASRPSAAVPKLVYRQDYCDHLVLTSGRCPVAVREVLLDTDLAGLLGVEAGDTVPLWWAHAAPEGGWAIVEPPLTARVVGVYRVPDPTGPYWGTEGYFALGAVDRGPATPIFTNPGTIAVLKHTVERQHVDAVLDAGTLTEAAMPAIRATLGSARGTPFGALRSSSIPALLDRLDRDRAALRQLTTGTAVALVLLGCFVLGVTVAYGAQDRRPELGVVRLRGARLPSRWWLGSGESLLPALAGIPLGLGLGALAGHVTAGALLHGAPVTFSAGDLRPAAITAGLVVVAVGIAYARPLALPAADVLRRIPPRGAAWRGATVQVLLVALAAVAVVQSRVQPGPLAGITLLTPALVVAAVAILAGRVLPPVAARLGRRGLGRRRLGLGLGALALARRPGVGWLLTVQVVAVGLIGFAAAGAAAGRHDRGAWVSLQLGAAKVLDLAPTPPAQLTAAVHDADPSGRFAMAVAALPQAKPGDPAALAVDASRLGSVAIWPEGTVGAATVATALRPAAPAPVTFRGTAIRFDIEVADYATTAGVNGVPSLRGNDFAASVRVAATFVPEVPTDAGTTVDGPPAVVDLGNLVATKTPGAHAYPATVPACAPGCRLVALTFDQRQGTELRLDLTVADLVVTAPAAPNAPTAPTTPAAPDRAVPLPWADPAGWRVAGGPDADNQPALSASPAGLRIVLDELTTAPDGVRVAPLSAPYPLPVVAAGAVPRQLNDAGGDPLAVRAATPVLPALPGIGAHGVLTDLDYLDRLGLSVALPLPGQVWLAADTPPAVVAALTAALDVQDTRDVAAEGAYLDRQGPAVGEAFGAAAAVAGVLLAAVGIALTAGVDRGARAAELRALRVQGLRPAVARRVAFVSHLGPIVAAGIGGMLAATAAWLLTAGRLPVFVDGPHAGLPPATVSWWALGAGVLAATAVLAVAATAAAVSLGRAVPRPDGGPAGAASAVDPPNRADRASVGAASAADPADRADHGPAGATAAADPPDRASVAAAPEADSAAEPERAVPGVDRG